MKNPVKNKFNINFILHWKLFDIVEIDENSYEISCFFLKMLIMKNRTCYYVDNIGLGVDFFSNKAYTSVVLKLIIFSVQFVYRKQQVTKLRIISEHDN